MSVQIQEKQGQKQSEHIEKTSVSSRQARYSASFFITFLVMFGLWLLLSGKFDRFHIFLGIISCLIVSCLSADLLLPSPKISLMPGFWFRFAKYVPWLIYQVFLANIHVMYLVFHPKMMDLIDPRIINFESRLKSDMALVTLANSITLTPGTITVYVSNYGDIACHVIDMESGKSLPWIMDARIADVFDEQDAGQR